MNRAVMFAGVLLAVAAAGGCTPKTVVLRPKEPRVEKLTPEQQLQAQVAQLEAAVRQKDQQIDTLQSLGGKRLENIFHVTRIKIGRYSGGIDTDRLPGDDQIVVYVTPVDQHGGDIKAAGSIRIRIFDLALPETDTLVNEYSWSPQQSAKLWPQGFMGNHFRLECPWTSGPPQHSDLVVRVEFTDYLTGKTFSAQRTCKVKLAGN